MALVTVLATFLALSSGSPGDEWPHLRGPDLDGGVESGGLASCVERATRLQETHDGCGRLIDRSSGDTRAVYRARWDDVVRNGFCVLPAERFVAR